MEFSQASKEPKGLLGRGHDLLLHRRMRGKMTVMQCVWRKRKRGRARRFGWWERCENDHGSLGAGKSHQTVINRDDRRSVLESLGSILEEKRVGEQEWLLSFFIFPTPIHRDYPSRAGLPNTIFCDNENVLSIHCPIWQYQLRVAIEWLKCDKCD